MDQEIGMTSDKKIKIIPIAPGEVHLQNEIVTYKCYICHCDEHDDMALIRIGDKKMAMVCLHHKGVLQEFISQFRRVPLGYTRTIIKE